MNPPPPTAGSQPDRPAGPADSADPADPGWGWLDEDDGSGWVPPPVDLTRPSAARLYDYYLGGKDNFPVDRQAAQKIIEMIPDVRSVALANRAFLAHAVHHMAKQGIRQFLDLGSGLPTSPNTHETARLTHPDAVVAYVDNDPIVLAHNRARVARPQGTCTINADLRSPAVVLDHPAIRRLIDFDQPVGILMIAVLHFVDYALAPHVVQRYLRALVPGSMLAISALQLEDAEPDAMATGVQVYQASTTPGYPRTLAQIRELFDDLHLVEPGLVDVTAWHRNTAPCSIRIACGIGVKH